MTLFGVIGFIFQKKRYYVIIINVFNQHKQQILQWHPNTIIIIIIMKIVSHCTHKKI